MRIFATAAALVMLAWPAWAQETKTVTDHAGFEVEIPAEPLRIVSLHDWTTTVMSYELGANLIGSAGRIDDNGDYYIRSGRELYDLGFDDIEMASVFGQLDMERIAALEPDLIIANAGDALQYRDQLNLIAPTLMYEQQNGRLPLDNYRDLANWVNRTDKFEELLSNYQARVAKAKTELLGTGPSPSYVIIMPNPEAGQIRIFRSYGAMSTVLNDLGFTLGSITDEVPPNDQDAFFSAEVISRLDTDYIFTHHIVADGETETSMAEQLDQIAPGYREVLPAVRNGKFLSLSRFHVYPTTFAAADYVLDQLPALLD